MKTIKNHVQLIGNIGQDPQVTNLDNGKIVAQFSMATNENYKTQKGRSKEILFRINSKLSRVCKV